MALSFAIQLLAAAIAARTPCEKPGFIVVAPRSLSVPAAMYAAERGADFRVEFAVLEDVLASSEGADDPERLKRYLYEAWRVRGVRYVLLVGDADVMPVRYMVLDRVQEPAFKYAFYPSDLYYADVAERGGGFEDWNASTGGASAGYYGEVRGERNKDGVINHDRIDYRPELAVGRWPVSTVEEVERVAAKSLAYERWTASAREARAALVCVGGWVDARGRMDQMAASLRGWETDRLFYSDGGEAGGPAPTEANVLGTINAGAALVLHAGHGDQDRWDGCIGMGSLAKLENAERPSVMMSAGCTTARFACLPPYEAYIDSSGVEHAGTNGGQVFTAPPPPPACYARGAHNPPGFGEQLLRAGPTGAAAYIGCNTGSQPCGLTLLEGFARAVGASSEPRLGDCWVSAIDFYCEQEKLEELAPTESWYPPSVFFQGMKFMVFGDPTLRLPHGESSS
jgi:hypothetical protein